MKIFNPVIHLFKIIVGQINKIGHTFTRQNLIKLKNSLQQVLTFVLLLILYLLNGGISWICNLRFLPLAFRANLKSKFLAFYTRSVNLLDTRQQKTISRIDLIELAIKNMKSKRTRTVVTVGGMMIGIGIIVFLVSIGYGVERLVVTRVARLDEMKQTDVSPQTGGKIKINDKTLSDFKDISGVESVLPLIAVVGRVNYMNSASDMAVYGVTTEYLKQSAIKLVEGKIFESNELSFDVSNLRQEVAGVSVESKIGSMNEKIQDIDFTFDPGTWIRVRESPSATSKIIGYTKRVEGTPQGEEVWGGVYTSDDEAGNFGETEDGKPLGKWIKSNVLLWKSESCDSATQGDCENGMYLVARDENNKQVQEEGYFAELGVQISGFNIVEPKVLGVSTDASDSAVTSTGDSTQSDIDWVEIASEAGIIKPPDTKTVSLSASAKKQAVVNRAMLAILGIKEADAIGKKFKTSFVVVGDLLSDPTANIESTETEYTIVGVAPEDKTPVFYVPFMDLRGLGITNFSQVKVVVKDQNGLAKARQQIESMGYNTQSVADTVAQINSLFSTARTILMLLGMVALAVASLGMFNTLTVSLLERTREVGLMKAMGMKSSEVKELFLTESMMMGFFGGILGIILGWVLGKLLGLILSFFAIIKGVGFVDVSYIPLTFILVIVFLSLFVGLVTGIYPARRATKISALNALRYE
jgi:ABC-type antimicrobial peptide transport system permease subunit